MFVSALPLVDLAPSIALIAVSHPIAFNLSIAIMSVGFNFFPKRIGVPGVFEYMTFDFCDIRLVSLHSRPLHLAGRRIVTEYLCSQSQKVIAYHPSSIILSFRRSHSVPSSVDVYMDGVTLMGVA